MDVREKAKNDNRLIDANAFLTDILTAGIGKTIVEYSESDIGYMIRKRPTVDAVEVVRCKDCKHRYKANKDRIIEMVVARASAEIVRKGLPRLMDKMIGGADDA